MIGGTMYQSPLSVIVGPNQQLENIKPDPNGLDDIYKFKNLKGQKFKTPFPFEPKKKTFTYSKYYKMWLGELVYGLWLGKSLDKKSYAYQLTLQVAHFTDSWKSILTGFEKYGRMIEQQGSMILKYDKPEFYIGEEIAEFTADYVIGRLRLDIFDYEKEFSKIIKVKLTDQIIDSDILMTPVAEQANAFWREMPKHDIELRNGLPLISRHNFILSNSIVKQQKYELEMPKMPEIKVKPKDEVYTSLKLDESEYKNYEAPPIDFGLI